MRLSTASTVAQCPVVGRNPVKSGTLEQNTVYRRSRSGDAGRGTSVHSVRPPTVRWSTISSSAFSFSSAILFKFVTISFFFSSKKYNYVNWNIERYHIFVTMNVFCTFLVSTGQFFGSMILLKFVVIF